MLHASALDVMPWWKYLAPSPQIVVVAIDDRAIARLRTHQAIPREYLASLIRGARRSGALAIGLAVDLSAPDPSGGDQALVDAINDAQAGGVPVVLSFVAQPDREMPGAYARPPLTLKAPAMGFVNDAVDAGGVVRHFRALVPRAPSSPRLGWPC